MTFLFFFSGCLKQWFTEKGLIFIGLPEILDMKIDVRQAFSCFPNDLNEREKEWDWKLTDFERFQLNEHGYFKLK